MSVLKRWLVSGAGADAKAGAVVVAAAGGDAIGAAPGRHAEDRALAHLQAHGLVLVERNYRVARGPHRRGGEIDLVMRDAQGTLVFVEVRSRRNAAHGGAAASVGAAKRASLVYAAQHYLLRWRSPPPCRFDLIAIDAGELRWLPAAFDAG
ncbi:MAG: YraN family protein [Leptothrix sp. (in: b-proteobacteria)]